jgi:hypothetical protein
LDPDPHWSRIRIGSTLDPDQQWICIQISNGSASRSAMDLHSISVWIRIHIQNADLDPEGVKRAKIKEKTKTKNRYIATKVPKLYFNLR